MQITERNCPQLKILKSNKLTIRDGSMDDHFMRLYDPITYMWDKNHDLWLKTAIYFTKNLAETIIKNQDKLGKLITEDFLIQPQVGAIIVNKALLCYHYFNEGFLWYLFINDYLVEWCYNIYKDGSYGWYDSEMWGKVFDTTHHLMVGRFINIHLMFMKHAKIEIKELKPGKKEVINNTRWINNSHNNITIVDSLWFTTLVRSEAFNVRGHFRLQPYKDRKELIWINEFEKHGYTRKANKIKYFGEDE